jgi:hypothetical protein
VIANVTANVLNLVDAAKDDVNGAADVVVGLTVMVQSALAIPIRVDENARLRTAEPLQATPLEARRLLCER